MNLEKKGAIIGAIWGMVSIFFSLLAGMGIAMGGSRNVIDSIPFLLLTLPASIPITIIIFLGPFNASGSYDSLSNKLVYGLIFGAAFVLPIFIGALLGYGIAKIYLKAKK